VIHTPDIRPATADDLLGVLRVLDAGLLETDAETIRTRITDDTPVLVADADGRVVGAVVLGERPAWVAEAFAAGGAGDHTDGLDDTGGDEPGYHIEAVAVGRSRRGRGLGTALLHAAYESVAGDLTADFAESVQPFYESLGCRIERVEEHESDDGTVEHRLVARVRIADADPSQSSDGEADG
jgi:ribosomal protein S18 acetylase RimI-like enzyme